MKKDYRNQPQSGVKRNLNQKEKNLVSKFPYEKLLVCFDPEEKKKGRDFFSKDAWNSNPLDFVNRLPSQSKSDVITYLMKENKDLFLSASSIDQKNNCEITIIPEAHNLSAGRDYALENAKKNQNTSTIMLEMQEVAFNFLVGKVSEKLNIENKNTDSLSTKLVKIKNCPKKDVIAALNTELDRSKMPPERKEFYSKYIANSIEKFNAIIPIKCGSAGDGKKRIVNVGPVLKEMNQMGYKSNNEQDDKKFITDTMNYFANDKEDSPMSYNILKALRPGEDSQLLVGAAHVNKIYENLNKVGVKVSVKIPIHSLPENVKDVKELQEYAKKSYFTDKMIGFIDKKILNNENTKIIFHNTEMTAKEALIDEIKYLAKEDNVNILYDNQFKYTSQKSLGELKVIQLKTITNYDELAEGEKQEFWDEVLAETGLGLKMNQEELQKLSCQNDNDYIKNAINKIAPKEQNLNVEMNIGQPEKMANYNALPRKDSYEEGRNFVDKLKKIADYSMLPEGKKQEFWDEVLAETGLGKKINLEHLQKFAHPDDKDNDRIKSAFYKNKKRDKLVMLEINQKIDQISTPLTRNDVDEIKKQVAYNGSDTFSPLSDLQKQRFWDEVLTKAEGKKILPKNTRLESLASIDDHDSDRISNATKSLMQKISPVYEQKAFATLEETEEIKSKIQQSINTTGTLRMEKKSDAEIINNLESMITSMEKKITTQLLQNFGTNPTLVKELGEIRSGITSQQPAQQDSQYKQPNKITKDILNPKSLVL